MKGGGGRKFYRRNKHIAGAALPQSNSRGIKRDPFIKFPTFAVSKLIFSTYQLTKYKPALLSLSK